jgi:hypothetical protein
MGSSASLNRRTGAGNLNWFRARCNEAGLPHCTAHGLRKAAATVAAENGATAHELVSIFGWLTLKEAERYTRLAERQRLAERGMAACAAQSGNDECLTSRPGLSNPIDMQRERWRGGAPRRGIRNPSPNKRLHVPTLEIRLVEFQAWGECSNRSLLGRERGPSLDIGLLFKLKRRLRS